MSTIDELVAKYSKVPGDIKIKSSDWQESYFVPFFKDHTAWHGLNQNGFHFQWTTDCDFFWELYTELRKKKKLYQWAYRELDGDWYSPCTFYAEVPKAWYAQKVQRLDYTMIEVDDE